MSQYADVERLMIKARTSLILNPKFVFFGVLALRLKMIPEPATETADTDGIVMRYNPDYVRGLTHDRRVALIAHETMHCAAGHPMRLGGREFERFNEACDYAINPILKDAGLDVGDDWLLDPQFANMASEEIYAKLPPKPPGGGGSRPGSVGGAGVFSPPKDPNDPQKKQPMSKDQQQTLARDWAIATMQAASVAKRAGDMPNNAEEMVEAMKHSRVDWREALKRFMTERAQDDYDWSQPNRRYVSQGIYLPSLRSEKTGAIVWATDTSISMDKEALEMALGEFNAVLDDVKPERVVYLECSTEVGHVGEYTAEDYPIESKVMVGRGGTRFAPVFRKVAELEVEPECLIYFTDLDCQDFGPEPPYPVLWCSTAKMHAPFGEVIRIDY